MLTRHAKLRSAKLFRAAPDRKLRGLLRGVRDLRGTPVTAFALAERNHFFSGNAADGVAGVFVVAVIQHRAARFLRKLPERCLQVIERVEIFHVILVNVEDDGDIRRKMQERIHIFAGLADEHLTLAGSAAAPDGRQLAADHRGKINAGGEEDLCQHGGGRRLAVCARDADRIVIPLRDQTEQLAALHHGNAACLGSRTLGIGLCDRGGIDHQVGIA